MAQIVTPTGNFTMGGTSFGRQTIGNTIEGSVSAFGGSLASRALTSLTSSPLVTRAYARASRSPCELYSDAKRAGQSAAVLESLRQKCVASSLSRGAASSVADMVPALEAPPAVGFYDDSSPEEGDGIPIPLIAAGVVVLGVAGLVLFGGGRGAR